MYIFFSIIGYFIYYFVGRKILSKAKKSDYKYAWYEKWMTGCQFFYLATNSYRCTQFTMDGKFNEALTSFIFLIFSVSIIFFYTIGLPLIYNKDKEIAALIAPVVYCMGLASNSRDTYYMSQTTRWLENMGGDLDGTPQVIDE